MGFLKESNGTDSAARLIFVIGSIWTMLLCTYFAVFSEIQPTTLVIMFSSMEAVWIGLKLGQKPMEQKK
jgi:hypothetical protein